MTKATSNKIAKLTKEILLCFALLKVYIPFPIATQMIHCLKNSITYNCISQGLQLDSGRDLKGTWPQIKLIKTDSIEHRRTLLSVVWFYDKLVNLFYLSINKFSLYLLFNRIDIACNQNM